MTVQSADDDAGFLKEEGGMTRQAATTCLDELRLRPFPKVPGKNDSEERDSSEVGQGAAQEGGCIGEERGRRGVDTEEEGGGGRSRFSSRMQQHSSFFTPSLFREGD